MIGEERGCTLSSKKLEVDIKMTAPKEEDQCLHLIELGNGYGLRMEVVPR